MARKSRRANVVQEKKEELQVFASIITQKQLATAAYARLSVEKENDESIQTQIELLHQYRDTIYVHYYSVKMGFIWNSWHGSYECDYRSCIWFHCCNRDSSTSSLVCNYISSECFNTKGAK